MFIFAGDGGGGGGAWRGWCSYELVSLLNEIVPAELFGCSLIVSVYIAAPPHNSSHGKED